MNMPIESERFPRLPRKPVVASRRSAMDASRFVFAMSKLYVFHYGLHLLDIDLLRYRYVHSVISLSVGFVGEAYRELERIGFIWEK